MWFHQPKMSIIPESIWEDIKKEVIATRVETPHTNHIINNTKTNNQ